MTPPTKPSDLAAYGALVTAALVWGGSIVAQKFSLGSFSAVEVSVLRGTGALAILVPLWWWQEGGTVKFSARDVGVFFVLGLGVLGNHLLTLFGLRYIGAAAAGVIIGASPVITALLSSLLIRDVPFSAVWALVILGLVSWALYTIGGRRTMERFSPLTVNWTTLGLSILLQIPLLWTDQKMMVAGSASVPVAGWVALAYLIVFATALGQQAWLYGVQGVGPSRAGVFVNLIPVSALVFSAIILGERIGFKEMAGIVLILAGVWLVNRQSARATRS